MVRIFLIALLLLLPAAARAEAPLWVMAPKESAITFKAEQMGKEFSGRFGNFGATIHFDPDHLDQSSVVSDIDIGSFDAGEAERNKNALSADWFDQTRFPSARFESTSFSKTGDGTYEVSGNLTIRDVTLPVKFPFTLIFSESDGGNKKAVMKGAMTLDRSAFHLGQGEWADPSVIANNVSVDIQIAAYRETP